MANVSLSTMWAQGRFQHFGDFVSAVRRMGFDGIEINYTVEPPGPGGADHQRRRRLPQLPLAGAAGEGRPTAAGATS